MVSSKLICLIWLAALALFAATASAQDSSLRVIGAGTVQVPTDTTIIAVDALNSSDNLSIAEEAASDLLNQTEKALLAVGVTKDEIMPDRSRGRITSHKVICNTINNTTTCKDLVINAAKEQMVIKLLTSDANQTKKVIEAAESAGAKANVLGYELSDPTNAVDLARKKAMENAKAKAEYYASSYGLTLGKSMQIEEPTYPDINIGPSFGWGGPWRMNHMLWMEPFPRMDRFWEDDYVPEGMVKVTAYVNVIYSV